MKYSQLTVCIMVLVSLLSFTGSATSATQTRASATEQRIYYEIGGANTIRPPANAFATTIQLPASAEVGLRYTCGEFDPLAGLLSSFEEIVALIANIDQVLGAALAALPMYILQRTNPGLYDLLQNMLLRAEELLSVSVKNCQQMEREMAQGIDPYQEWMVLSRGDGWRATIGSGGVDARQAEKEVDANLGLNGVPWLCGVRAGGQNHKPIAIVGDVTQAGWNIMMGRESCATDAADTTDERLAEFWASPEEAREWTTQTVGDVLVKTDGTPSFTRPGIGPTAEIAKNTQEIYEALVKVSAQPNPTFEELEMITGGGQTFISRPVLDAIKNHDPAEQAMLLTRLSQDIATQLALEKLLLAKRLLLSGLLDPNVRGTPAHTQVQPFINTIDKEVEALLLEREVRMAMAAGTVTQILKTDARRNARGRPTTVTRDAFEMIEGGVSDSPINQD